MGQYAIRMPDIGEGIAEVELVAWRVQPGDTVREDQILADVMTDKATVEIPSPVAGKVASLGGQPGQMMAVGSELIRLEVEGAGNVKLGDAESARTVAVTAPAAAAAPLAVSVAAPTSASVAPPLDASPQPPASTPLPVRAPEDRPIASPAVRRRAWELGIDLQYVHGSGPAGRIMQRDLDVYQAARGQPVPGAAGTGHPSPVGVAARTQPTEAAVAGWVREAPPTSPSVGWVREATPTPVDQTIPLIGLRRRIARKMQEAKRRIPHFTYVEEVDVTELETLRARLNDNYAASRGKLTLLPLLARAVVLALADFPQMNARFDDDAGVVTRSAAVHLGIATQTDAGLLVPVLRNAEALDLWACARAIARLADEARGGKITRDELSGSTITITSLGPLGGIVTTPIINHPEVAIIGVNRIVERPVARNGAVVLRQLMNLSSSFDHRVVDGMDAARFIQAIRALLEQPALLFVD
ncbi:MAG TPA: dihydrolipoamide acetyltransferase family protein [Ramlibacter sp.]|nr:dihydrolipoamide acetyltransferase family protein [Ramlibacter sp.]